ncbi:MAG: bis(5'-nucleosyl)-tetraphosphatase (symmetrical) YqeK, partial [Oscillospiraceae bacterium]
MDINKIIEIIKSRLSEERFVHSMNVAKQAKFLGEIYGEDTEKLYLAGVVHDACKEIPYDEQLNIIKSGGIEFDKYAMHQEKIWHAVAGSVFIQKELEIFDEQVIDAVRYHTTAKENMDTFSKIVYISDITSDERDYPQVDLVRKLAKEDL